MCEFLKETSNNSARCQSSSDHLLVALLKEIAHPAELVELYYLSREPTTLRMLRGLMALPVEERVAVERALEETFAARRAAGPPRAAPAHRRPRAVA